MARQKRCQFLWFAPPTVMYPSLTGRAWYGADIWWADPFGPGDLPVVK